MPRIIFLIFLPELRIADLRLIFRATEDENGQKGKVFGYVHWYSPTKNPH
jgi:hypothetical protein